MNEKLVLITSGKGPDECERVVHHLLRQFSKQAEKEKLQTQIIDAVEGRQDDTLLSVLLRVRGENADRFCAAWEGTIQWIAQSPFRKFNKRKNWFAGISVYDPAIFPAWNEKEIVYQTLRASGPGGQHVNKTDSAVRATHVPSGISVTASDERSQSMNKKVATERLKNKLLSQQVEEKNKQVRTQWLEHHSLERGNAVKVFREEL
jgi:peptide chain release factor